MTDDIMDLRDDIFEGAVASPEDYADQVGFRPIPEGKYTFKINKLSIDKDENGAIRNPKAPTINLEELEVVGGDFDTRKAMFMRVRSNTYERRPGVKASELGDLMRALDRTYAWGGSITRAWDYLNECRDKGTTFKARVRWEAWDSDHWSNGDGANLEKDEQKALAKECRVQGMKQFPSDGNGGYIPEIVGKSGATLTARLGFAQFYPSEG